jgi:group I intron endonuclease
MKKFNKDLKWNKQVVIYKDLNLKAHILNENKGKAGVYCLTNTLNGKTYIGSSNNLRRRFYDYFNINTLIARRHRVTIYKALLKYGHSNFTLEILEYCDISDLLKRETYYIRLLNPSYNILKQGGSLLGFKHSEATLAKMRGRKHSDATREKMRLIRLGRKLSVATILKLRGQKRSEISREKMRLARLGRRHSEATLTKLRNRSWKLSAGTLLKRKNIKYSEETRAKHRAVWLGRKHSDATREKISIAAFHRKHSQATLEKLKGRKITEEHRAKIGTSVEVKNIKTGETVKYKTMTEAGQALSVTQPLIKKYLITGELLKKTYIITSNTVKTDQLSIGAAIRKLPVLVKNIETGKTVEYVTMTEAGKSLGTTRQTISSYVKSGKLLKNTYIITPKASSVPTS